MSVVWYAIVLPQSTRPGARHGGKRSRTRLRRAHLLFPLVQLVVRTHRQNKATQQHMASARDRLTAQERAEVGQSVEEAERLLSGLLDDDRQRRKFRECLSSIAAPAGSAPGGGHSPVRQLGDPFIRQSVLRLQNCATSYLSIERIHCPSSSTTPPPQCRRVQHGGGLAERRVLSALAARAQPHLRVPRAGHEELARRRRVCAVCDDHEQIRGALLAQGSRARHADTAALCPPAQGMRRCTRNPTQRAAVSCR